MSNPRLNRKNWQPKQCWYRIGHKVVWWDRGEQVWIFYHIDNELHQIGSADFYGHITHFKSNHPEFF